MLDSIKIVYKSFYDSVFTKNYIKNGSGEGVLPLGIVALITSLILSVMLIVTIKTTLNQENIDQAISEIKRQMPTIAVQNGNLVWEDNVVNEYYFADNSVKLTVDTRERQVNYNDIKNSHFYLTKTHLYINNTQNHEIKDFELKNINVIAQADYVDLTSEETLNGLVNVILQVMDIAIFAITIIVFLFYWIINCFLCKLTRFFAKLIFKDLKELKADMLERAITASIIPAILVVDILSSFTGTPSWIVRWIAIIAFGVFIVKKHLSEPSENK